MTQTFIMTFHWATNYGAVLQSFALQTYLMEHGKDVHIIDYVPKGFEKTLPQALIGKSVSQIRKQLREYQKERKMRSFRKKYLRLTKRFLSLEDLRNHEWPTGVYICGSDQIWNPYFTMHGEKGVTTSYFLDFLSKGQKIAFAASFGVTSLNNDMKQVIAPLLRQFDRISVRELTGVSILEEMGIQAELVCDPVFLIQRTQYERLMSEQTDHEKVFTYILHKNQDTAYEIAAFIQKRLQVGCYEQIDTMSIEEWLSVLRSAKFVVTNSFHAIAFSIIFHIPFIAILIRGNGMNDRLLTLLSSVGMEYRTICDMDEAKINYIIQDQIDWNAVDNAVQRIRERSQSFLLR